MGMVGGPVSITKSRINKRESIIVGSIDLIISVAVVWEEADREDDRGARCRGRVNVGD